MSQLAGTTDGLVARIESLKRWQLEQQEKLLAQQSQQSVFLSNEHKRMYQALGLEPLVEQEDLLNLTTESNRSSSAKLDEKYLVYDDSEPECFEDNTEMKYGNPDHFVNNPENLDEKPLELPCRDFTELLEAKLQSERTNFPLPNNNNKVKKPFLKRGTGLSRFRMSINDLPHSKPKSNQKLSLNKVNSIVKTGARKTNQVCTNELNKNHVLQKKEVGTSESHKNVSRKKVVENRTKQRNSEENHYPKHQNDIDTRTDVRTDERVLNTVEQTCIRPLDTVEDIDKFEINLLPKDAATYNTPDTRATCRTMENNPNPVVPDYQTLLAELMEVRRRDPSLFDTPVINNSADNSQRIFEREMHDELKIFELLEQKAANSSFCSTSSLVMRLMEHSVKSTPKRVITINSRQLDESNSERNKELSPEHSEHPVKLTPKRALSFPSRDLVETVYEEDAEQLESSDTSDNECVLLDSSSSSVNSDDISDRVQTSRPISDKSRQLQNEKKTFHLQVEKRDATTNTDTCSVSPELLKTRLEQLENEIATFRSENARVAKLKSELQTDQRNFEKRKRQLEKEIDEQKRQMNFILETEKAKLAKDKLVYDKYARELKEGKTARKKEREEISALRSQISTIEEEFRMKESRWGATQARLRNQLRQLEKDNVALKTENNELRTKNGKLEASHKQLVTRRPTDTKVLHEINKNLTKLAQEAKVKTPPSIGCKAEEDTSKRKSRSKTRTDSTKRVSVLSEPEYNKENDSNSLNINNEDSKSSLDHSFELVEKEYERMFGKLSVDNDRNEDMVLPVAEASSCSNTSGQREETVLEDGSTQTTYSNGNVRIVSADGQFIVMRYHNGDVKETCHNTGTIRYLYADACTWHTTFPDGLELLEFSNGQTEKRFANGASEIYFPNGCKRCTSPGGTEEVTFPDGTLLVTQPGEGEKILTLPNGQREIHTADHKRREYPDGTVKLIYHDGVQETRYANGRIRLKDKHGNLIMDSAGV